MTGRPATVVLDNEAVVALADLGHPKHTAVVAVLEVTNQRRRRNEHLRVVVPKAGRVEAGSDRTNPDGAELNRTSRAADVSLDAGATNRCVRLRQLVTEASVVDVTVAEAAESAPLQPVTIVTSDVDDMNRLVGHLGVPVVVTLI